MKMDKQEIKKIIKEVIDELKPKDFCYVCGERDITIHHMRMNDIKSKKNKKGINGIIFLCPRCHQIVEDIVNKGKSKKLWYEKGYKEGYNEAMKIKKDF